MGSYKVFFILTILSILTPRISKSQIKDSSFSFTLGTNAATSAGVYKSNGTLIRTLWSNVSYTAGNHIGRWDGLLDDGTPAPDDAYQIQVLSGNVNYEWEGAVIGNTSTNLTGNTKLRFFDPLASMAVSNNTIYWAAGYNEGWPASYKTSINNPDSKTWIGPLKETNQLSAFVCTDDSLVYWGGLDPLDSNYETFVYATSVKNDQRFVFSNGVPASMEWGSTYESTVSYMKTDKAVPSVITGLAVEKNGNYLFVTRKGLNQLQVLNKFTGALVQSMLVDSPNIIQADHNNNIWLAHGNVVEKYITNLSGSFTSSGIIISLSNIGAISISPDNSTVIIADISTNKVKAYSNDTGELLWELGKPASYINDALVEDDKFYWKDVRQEYPTFLYYMPDGSFYVGDQQNRRVQHFNANRVFIDNIMYLPATYSVQVDPNNPTRVFADFLEFKIDYNKPLATNNGSWELIKNWGGNIGNQYDLFEKMRCIVTLSNGHTYARLREVNDYKIFELVENGAARFTGVQLPPFGFLNKDGSVINCSAPVIGQSQQINTFGLIKFDNLNNPVWSSVPDSVTTTPVLKPGDTFLNGFTSDPFTNSGQIIFFDPAKSQTSTAPYYHLSSVKNNQWSWKTASATSLQYTGPFPDDGYFDIGNGVVYPGGSALVSEKNIFWGYHGEFWKQSQTNKWNHVYDNGLLVGQFGELTSDHFNEEAFAGGAGNVLSGNIVIVNGVTYLYHNDESVHGAVHRWKITGLNTIQVQNAIYPSPYPIPVVEGIDLLTDLIRGRSLQNNFAGWNRTPANNNTEVGNYFVATIGDKTYDKFKNPDLFLSYAQKNGNALVTRQLGNNLDLTSWKLSAKVNFDINTPNEPRGLGGSYFEVLDKNNQIIAQFYIGRDINAGFNVVGNEQVMYNTTGTDLQVVSSRHQPLVISAVDSIISFKYADYSTLATTHFVDSNADWRSPTTVRVHFFTNNIEDNFTRSIDISELRFSTNSTNIILPATFASLKAYQKETGVQVEWSASNDFDADRYEIEKSYDGQTFLKGGEVKAISAGITNNYNWFDSNPEKGNNYYRIKTIYLSGTRKYSNILTVKISGGKKEIALYPNPISQNNIIIKFTDIPKGNYNIDVFDNAGHKVYNTTINHAGNSASHSLSFGNNLPAGLYQIQIIGNGLFFNKKIAK